MSSEKVEIVLSEQELERLTQCDNSITQWSVQHIELSIKLKNLLEAIEKTMTIKQNIISNKLKLNGIDIKNVVDASIDESGKLEILMK